MFSHPLINLIKIIFISFHWILSHYISMYPTVNDNNRSITKYKENYCNYDLIRRFCLVLLNSLTACG